MDSRVFIQLKVLNAKVKVFRAYQGETHFSFVRDTGLETLSGMTLFQISSYMTVLGHCWDLPQRVVRTWVDRDGWASLVPPRNRLLPFLFLNK